MGLVRNHYTFMNHLRWAWAIALGYVASVSTHLWVNAAFISARGPGYLSRARALPSGYLRTVLA